MNDDHDQISADDGDDELGLPLVLCRSRGGPFDDDAFRSGWRLGDIGSTLGRLGVSALAESIRPCGAPAGGPAGDGLRVHDDGRARQRSRLAQGHVHPDAPTSPEATTGRPMRILLLCSAFNGLTQRTWVELRQAGHEVGSSWRRTPSGDQRRRAMDPDLVICPFLRERVPTEVWTSWPTIIVHPGPKGDRGPSSLDWALMDAESIWGVTALQAVEEMDAGPIWGTRTFPVATPRKSDLYNVAVTDAAFELIHEVVNKAADRSFVPAPLDERRPDVGAPAPMVRPIDRAFRWSDPTSSSCGGSERRTGRRACAGAVRGPREGVRRPRGPVRNKPHRTRAR